MDRWFRSLALAVLLLGVSQAYAGILYTNGAIDEVGATEATNQVNADNFMTATNASVTGFSLDVAWLDSDGDTLLDTGDVYYVIYPDNAGEPGTFSALDVGVNVTKTFLFTSGAFGLDIYKISFDLVTPFALIGGQSYWLTVFFDTVDDNLFWMSSAPGALPDSVYESDWDFGIDGPWASNGYDLSFQVSGGIPVPAPVLLLGFGLIAVARLRSAYRA